MFGIVICKKTPEYYVPLHVIGGFWNKNEAKEYSASTEFTERHNAWAASETGKLLTFVTALTDNKMMFESTIVQGDKVRYLDKSWYVTHIEDDRCILSEVDSHMNQRIAELKNLTLVVKRK